MARKTKEVTIDKVGSRDHGKTFLITEMSAQAADAWALRAMGAMVRSGTPDNPTATVYVHPEDVFLFEEAMA